jgi:hypothetical protein
MDHLGAAGDELEVSDAEDSWKNISRGSLDNN